MDGISDGEAMAAQRLYDRSVTELHTRLADLKGHYKELTQVSRTLVCIIIQSCIHHNINHITCVTAMYG